MTNDGDRTGRAAAEHPRGVCVVSGWGGRCKRRQKWNVGRAARAPEEPKENVDEKTFV